MKEKCTPSVKGQDKQRFPLRPPEHRIRHLLDRLPIAAQPHCCREACRGERQPDPETGSAQGVSRRERTHRHAVPCEGSTFLSTAEELTQHGGQMRRV